MPNFWLIAFYLLAFPVVNVELENADPNSNATIFAEYNAISDPIRDEIGIRSLSQLTALLEGPASGAGLRPVFWTWTVKLDKEMATVTKDIFFEELPSILDASDLVPAVSLQVLTDPILRRTKLRGGNVLGPDPKDGPLMLVLVALEWSNSADDSRLNELRLRLKIALLLLRRLKAK
ncbi:hypothetical protein J1614_008620 [Plenodomus biglobosus]|nr:hypothetical protein J1614_008620 [Plenodomus biglobosus]